MRVIWDQLGSAGPDALPRRGPALNRCSFEAYSRPGCAHEVSADFLFAGVGGRSVADTEYLKATGQPARQARCPDRHAGASLLQGETKPLV